MENLDFKFEFNDPSTHPAKNFDSLHPPWKFLVENVDFRFEFDDLPPPPKKKTRRSGLELYIWVICSLVIGSITGWAW